MFLSGTFEGTVRAEPTPLGNEGLVEVYVGRLHSYRDYSGDLEEVHHHVPRRLGSPVERDGLAQETLSFRQGTEFVTAITQMFHEKAQFCLEHVSSEQARMSRYLSILRRYIREFMANSMYRTFFELQANARKREIKLRTQAKEEAEPQNR